MRLKRAIIKHTDQIHNWQEVGGALSWRLMQFYWAKSHSRHLVQARLHGRGRWGWQQIGWEPSSSLGRQREEWRLAKHLGILPTGDRFPATSPLAPPAPVFSIPWRLSSQRVPDTPEGWPWESHYAYNQSVPPHRPFPPAAATATATRTTAASTLNLTAGCPPLMHLHTEDRPNKVINQRPIFKWFAGRLKPLHTLPQVNSPTCSGARYPFSSAVTGTVSTGHPDINIYLAPLHCWGTNYINVHMLIAHMPKAN